MNKTATNETQAAQSDTAKSSGQRPQRQNKPKVYVAHKDMVQAIKTAFCYMPEPSEITEENYGNDTERTREEVENVRNILTQLKLDPEKIYNEMQ
jgi:hypothetical protein